MHPAQAVSVGSMLVAMACLHDQMACGPLWTTSYDADVAVRLWSQA